MPQVPLATEFDDDHADDHAGRDIDDAFREEEICRIADHRTYNGIPDNETTDPTHPCPDDTEDECFVQEHPAHLPFFCSDRQQDTDLLHPFVDGHHHDIEDADCSDDKGYTADCKDECCDGAEGGGDAGKT